jgi:hypothetical protein
LSRTTQDEDSSSEEEDNEDSDSSSDSEHDEETPALERPNNAEPTTAAATTSTVTAEVPDKPKPNKRPPKKNQKDQMTQQMGTSPLISLPFSDTQVLHVPTALLTKHEKFSDHKTQCSSLLEMITKIAAAQPVIVLLLRSGRFAGGVFPAERCIAHRVCASWEYCIVVRA